ncbi:MAG TPA: glutamine--fructose-6-phosphate transaminase (isomerizing), partial [Thermomicrobiales bacterium]|nr:glutamine--fructose-6-phosphate transaminase (isomerizing) [Thermomicrobiales bacterium]
MCGVFGYVGARADVGGSVLKALRTLEYRGYDSWGVAVAAGDAIRVEKRAGRINGATLSLPASDIGFGHTRWATHGGVTDGNAHPHLDCSGRLAIVHNGIVENHRALRAELIARGHRFRSETDSEVIAHLLEERIAAGADLTAAVRETFALLAGLNAIVAMDIASRELVATKNVSPLVAGLGRDATVIASDAIALVPHAERLLYLEDGQLLRANKDGATLYDRATMRPLTARFAPIDWDAAGAELGAYPHFMAKEMAEQPAVI